MGYRWVCAKRADGMGWVGFLLVLRSGHPIRGAGEDSNCGACPQNHSRSPKKTKLSQSLLIFAERFNSQVYLQACEIQTLLGS